MTGKIAIVGLGQIGGSIGLALRQRQGSPQIVGNDRDGSVARAAEALGAVDSTAGLKAAVKDADIVVLSLPLGEMQETIRRICPDLKPGAVLIDTAPVKSIVWEWAEGCLGEGRHYLGIVPAVGTSAISSIQGGIRSATPDLFRGALMVVTLPAGTPAPVEQLALNFVRLLGAKPMLTDMAEADGIMTTAHILPQLAAAGLLEATVSEPGWAEGRKLAGRPFAGVTGGLAYYDDPESLEAAALSNRELVKHALEVLIASLQGLHDDIAAGDRESVRERLQHSFKSREHWLDERGAASWLSEGGAPAEVPGLGDQVVHMLFGGRIVDRMKDKSKPAEPDKDIPH